VTGGHLVVGSLLHCCGAQAAVLMLLLLLLLNGML
jgi:hypothetical protein